MGHSESKAFDKEAGKAPPPKIRSNTYFGGNGQMGDIDEDHIDETIRDLTLERLYQRAPQLRPKDPSEQQPKIKLRTLVSIKDPAPYIKTIGAVNILAFGLMTEAPCRIVMIASNFINSISVEVCSSRTQISLPIPANSSCLIEIQPDLDHATVLIDEDSRAVTKHALIFKYIEIGPKSFQYHYLEQQIFDGEKCYHNPVNTKMTQVAEEATGLCYACLKNKADVAIAPCGHNVMCQSCLADRKAHFHHCPVCNEITSF